MASEEFRKRTFEFGIRCIRLVESLPKTMVAQTLGKQLLRSATSVGANYRSAVRARSRSEFIAKMGIVEEECDESLHWIEVLLGSGFIKESLVKELQREGSELLAISVQSIKTARKNAKNSR
jgi:four helix bundle protein